MLNIVLYEPEIPTNTGNIMRTCVATNTRLHLIEPLGFSLDEKSIKRSGVNYIDKLEYYVYKDFEDFKNKNKGTYYYFTRYGNQRSILGSDLDHCMRIPMTSNVRSLNLSNCCAIVVYEVLRQLDYLDLLRVEPHKSEDFIINGIEKHE